LKNVLRVVQNITDDNIDNSALNMKFKYKNLFFILVLFSGCENDTYQFTTNIEEVLPGRWLITSIQLPAIEQGIEYQGKFIFHDTTLTNVGELEFGTFDFYGLDSGFAISSNVTCNFKIENEDFPFIVNNFSISGGEMRGFFSQIIAGGIDIIDTPGEEFVWSSSILNNNYSVFMIDTQNVILESFRGHLIELMKIE
jgi:hypothetical protein